MSEQDHERQRYTPSEALTDETRAKIETLLREDGNIVDLADLGPSLYVEYSLEPPRSIGGNEVTSFHSESDAKLLLQQKSTREGLSGRIIAVLKILESGIESSSFTFVFNEGKATSLQYRKKPQFFSREASKEELEDFLKLLHNPLYLFDS